MIKKISMLCAVACCGLLFSGCDAILGLFRSPEDVVISYVEHIADIVNSDEDCGKKAERLTSYCDRSKERVTAAISEITQREMDGKGDASSEKKLKELSESLDKHVQSLGNGKCLLSPEVIGARLMCLTPLKEGVLNSL